MAARFFALLVGIDRYANPYQAPHLRGCVADIEGTYALLVHRFGVPPAQIRRLVAPLEGKQPTSTDAGELPTRANILAAWRDHFGQAGPGDVVFFHYSGHGSQARSVDPDEPDGFDETLVPHDARTPGVYDIADKELATLIRAVEERGAQVFVFLDCCHAGSGTRGLPLATQRNREYDYRPLTRTCPPDLRVRQASEDALAPGFGPQRTRTPSGWLPLGKHVLLAACRDDELSYEYRTPGTGQWHGAASFFLHRALAAASPAVTWARLHDQLLTQVKALYPAQTPQLEGPGDLTFFGASGVATQPYLLVTAIEGDEYIQVSGGAAVGLTPSSRLAVYAPDSDLQGEPLAVGLVEEIAVDHAWAKLDRIAAIPLASRVKVQALGWDGAPLGVRSDDALLRQALATLAGSDRAPFLRALDVEQADAAVFHVHVDRGCYVVTDAHGAPLWGARPPASPDGAARVAAALYHMAVYANVQRLHNPAPPPALAEALRLEVVAYPRATRGERPAAPEPLHDRGHTPVVAAGSRLQLTIHNRSDEALYLALFNLDADYGITRIYPGHAVNQKVAPGHSVVLDPIAPRMAGPDPVRSRETLKVIATRVPVSLDVLQLPKLEQGDPQAGVRGDESSPLGRLLNAVRRAGSRDLVLETDDPTSGWITAQLDLTVVAAPQRHLLPPDLVRVVIDADAGWTLEKPADWSGVFYLADADQAARGRSPLALPPGLTNPAAAVHLRPVLRGEAQGARPGPPVVVGLTAAADQMEAVTRSTPLRLEVPVADEPGLAGVAAVAYDGRHFYWAGLPAPGGETAAAADGVRRLACDLFFLPPLMSTPEPARDLPRAARLYFYKIFTGALPPADSGLRQADLVDGRVVYGPGSGAILRRALTEERRVALLIHGFAGESRSLVERLWGWVRRQGNYDLCLTFDYETFATPIRRSAEQLAAALTDLGFGADKPPHLDLYTYNQGALVARALVELAGGDAYVARIFMGGPPNAGTPLAKGISLIPWLANLALNIAGAVPPALVAHWLLEQFVAGGAGLADLAPDSDFLAELNAAHRPAPPVPYFIQTGDNSRAYAHWHSAAQRLMALLDGGLDTLYGGDNDLLVSVASARSLEGRQRRLAVQVIGGHAFDYFTSAEAQRGLARWLG